MRNAAGCRWVLQNDPDDSLSATHTVQGPLRCLSKIGLDAYGLCIQHRTEPHPPPIENSQK